MNDSQNYFKFSELVTTDTGLPNYPLTPAHLANITRIWSYLNSVREKLGAPIIVNSAFRTPQVNKQIGGAKCSYHMDGRAADICTSPHKMAELYAILCDDVVNIPLAEFIKYSTFYHIAL